MSLTEWDDAVQRPRDRRLSIGGVVLWDDGSMPPLLGVPRRILGLISEEMAGVAVATGATRCAGIARSDIRDAPAKKEVKFAITHRAAADLSWSVPVF
jgi:hypothetical protein